MKLLIHNKVILFLALVITLVGGACKKKISRAELDDKIINKYITDHNLNAKATGSGLYYVVAAQGSGAQPNINSNVTVVYKGTLVDGTVFDQSKSTSGSTFNLANVIKGWQEGIPLYNKSGKGTLLIPSALGYGDKATGAIPASSVLIFDIELLDVK